MIMDGSEKISGLRLGHRTSDSNNSGVMGDTHWG